MTAPAYKQNGPTGGSFSGATFVETGYPVASNAKFDLVVLQVSISDANPTITWPSDFTEIYQGAQTADFYFGCAWKRLEGTENGVLATTNFSTASSGTSRMVAYSGVTTYGLPYESHTASSGTSASADCAAIVTTGDDRLGVHVYGVRSNVATSPPGSWTEHVDAGASSCRHIQESLTIASAGTEAATSRTIAAVDWITSSFALLPPIETAGVVWHS